MTRAVHARPPARNKRAEVDLLLAAIEDAKQTSSRRDALIDFLRDEHPMYRDRGAIDVARLRGFVMRTFADVGLPGDALPFVLEDLQSSVDAYAVAAAAQALRGWMSPSLDVIPLLRQARENIHGKDEFVSFASYDAVGDLARGTTASAEIDATLKWLTAAAKPAAPVERQASTPSTCCCGSAKPAVVPKDDAIASAPQRRIADLEFEDQDARRLTFAQMLTGRPSAVTFFYTRCENPRKCSLTIQKLGRLQKGLAALSLSDRVRIAAITYDPLFDSAERLRAYASARGFEPNNHHRLLRTTGDMQPLQDYFSLGVNYVQSNVNRHRVELYVLDDHARIAESFVRLEWDEEKVLGAVKTLIA
jgi:protein SCO1/2